MKQSLESVQKRVRFSKLCTNKLIGFISLVGPKREGPRVEIRRVHQNVQKKETAIFRVRARSPLEKTIQQDKQGDQ